MKENPTGRNGLMADLFVECNACHDATPLKTSSTITTRGQSFDANWRAVYHSLETGGDYEGLTAFCSIMNLPCLPELPTINRLTPFWKLWRVKLTMK